MAIEIFRDREDEYLKWIAIHPNSFVLTTSRSISIHYMSLHTSNCHHISSHNRKMANNAFTGQKFIKICSDNVADLYSWILENGGVGFTQVCKTCNPDVTDCTTVVNFEEQVKISLNDPVGRRIRLATAPEFPVFRKAVTISPIRNPDVVAEVLERSNGICECCLKPAPFFKKSDNSPYLVPVR